VLIAAYDVISNALLTAHCSDVECNAATVTLLDTSADIGSYASITIGADGLGLISYLNSNNGDLKVAHCSNVNCTSATISTLDSTGDVGYYTGITTGYDGLGLISYYDNTARSKGRSLRQHQLHHRHPYHTG